jgi:nucleotide-binding universal stress UspA family protein
MTYRTLLVHVDRSRQSPARILAAAALARQFDAHLVGAALTGVCRYLLPGSLEMGGAMLTDQIDAMHIEARAALAQFGDLAGSFGVRSAEPRLVNDDVDGGMVLAARYADLTVVSQSGPGPTPPGVPGDLPEYLLLNSGRPVLVCRQADGKAPSEPMPWSHGTPAGKPRAPSRPRCRCCKPRGK